MTDKQDVIVSLLKEIDKNVENLGGFETDVLLSNRITNVENKAATNEGNIATLNKRVTTLENAEPSGGGGGTTSGGYPVVTVEDDFNITAEPNTFYDIKNDTNSEININFVEDGYSARSQDKHILFTFDGWDTDEMFEAAMLLSYTGGKVVSDTSREGYTYRMDINYFLELSHATSYLVPVYFSEMPETGKSVEAFVPLSEMNFGEDVSTTLSNIQIVNADNDYLVEVSLESGASVVNFLTEVTNDNSNFQYKYSIWGIFNTDGLEYVYTNKPYINIMSTDDVYIDDGVSLALIGVNRVTVKLNKNILGSDTLKEFVFNVNSPANVIFNQNIKWHNNNIPDLTASGLVTISVFNQVGCYTFVNN